eukprot:CAMPEP_0179337260 /NCGR_PEP_ID=MMETSP0797-20121207/67520_1 /TAXON_ID=47934 /ORGANISM="Dinophysis acuminata, Strain DAEP01" /LENGTH=197 /DNA_ID=CAMNT_0021050879 /DNA_START=480 /DNA_END=1070 /DNA_ORIENTATION=+
MLSIFRTCWYSEHKVIVAHFVSVLHILACAASCAAQSCSSRFASAASARSLTSQLLAELVGGRLEPLSAAQLFAARLALAQRVLRHTVLLSMSSYLDQHLVLQSPRLLALRLQVGSCCVKLQMADVALRAPSGELDRRGLLRAGELHAARLQLQRLLPLADELAAQQRLQRAELCACRFVGCLLLRHKACCLSDFVP